MQKADIMDAADGTVNQTSVPYQLGDLKEVSVHIKFTGTDLAGTSSLEASNDGLDWIQVSGSSQAVVNSGSVMYNLIDAAYQWLRAQWVYSSGTGTISFMRVVAKEPINRQG